MSVASEITRLQGVKSDILQAISDKGVTVPADSALDDCPELISSISGGGGSWGINGGKEYIVQTHSCPIICTNDYMKCIVQDRQQAGDGQRFGVCPNYANDIKWNDLEIGDEIEINEIVNISRYGSGRTQLFTRCGLFYSENTDRYKFEINNYDGTCWFSIFGSDRGGMFAFNYNQNISINFLAKKIDVDKVNFKCVYENVVKFNSALTMSSTIMSESCLPAFGGIGQNNGFIYNSKLLKGSYIRIKNDILFGEPL